MEWLNYHHLLYFWVAANEGSLERAGKVLGLARPTVSAQVHQLEEVLGEKLFVRRGRNLELTEQGALALRYAEEIFTLGRELVDTMKGRETGRALRLVVGVSDVLAKSMVHKILEPAFGLDQPLELICRADRSVTAFLGELATHTVDIVLSDAPAGPSSPVRTFSHPLGECGTTFFAAPSVAKRFAPGFPGSLGAAPLLMPASGSTLRRAIETWLRRRNLRPKIAAELDDAALAVELAEAGLGIYAAPSLLEAETLRRYKLRRVGRAKDLRQRFFAISMQRKFVHPAVAAICTSARERLFG